MTDYSMNKWGAFLATRDRGRDVRDDIEKCLVALKSDRYIVLDFAGIEEITISFGDECVAKLLADRSSNESADWGVALTNVNTEVRESLSLVLSRRKLAAVVLTRDSFDVIGDHGWLAETLNVASELRSFRANDLADRLGLTAQAANNRLKQLVSTGAVRRQRVVPEGGGKEFVYDLVIPQHA